MILNEEQILIRDTARAFARDHLTPNAAAWDREKKTPRAVFSEMGELGLLGMLAPEQWGGVDAGFVSFVLAMEEIAAGDGGVSTTMSVHNGVATMPIVQYGSDEQKKRFLPGLTSGEIIGAFALTEAEAGSDAANLKCSAKRDGDHYVLNGTKLFISSGVIAGIVIVFALTDPAAGKKGISAFIVPTDTEGYSAGPAEQKLGQRGHETVALMFDNMRLPADLLLGPEGAGYKIALSNLEGGRIGIAAQSVGMARAAYHAARDYARERVTFGKPIVDHQAVAFRLADMATGIEVARQMALHAASLRDAGQPCLAEASMAKLFASETAEKICTDAIQIHGGYGYLEDFPVERIYRDVRVCQIYEGTSDIQRMVIARSIMNEG
ncbi:MAG: acyl-CoA dehydrogenase [Rhodospirillaceae bacterium]|jgi:butyryl-CoA dehydrogenase|nr:acyl-CoA dehydrogenase [Rhodospirillaceae bacterium]MBT5244279.1 acyl-CoA dehydrogenase [Rhodospirillaceae bacterium]MBT5563640.1 acyl-CoA dehydrogenase [Rhodospirillaceae bacterium]MBT6241470.1 acyl-CoA dehydrogenase [Rhodospirillaceae bacterium]MBT7138827.1 acyl-CoA dehydrogenase [Rhodospirillaceae bacterium]